MKLVIRDQKTSRNTGSYICPVHDVLKELLMFWINDVRPQVADENHVEHCNVFFNLTTLKPFDQQGFSKYISRAFVLITGKLLNLQLIRRVFTNGM